MNCVNQNNIQVYGMRCYWQNLIELQSIGFSLNNLLLFSVRKLIVHLQGLKTKQ